MKTVLLAVMMVVGSFAHAVDGNSDIGSSDWNPQSLITHDELVARYMADADSTAKEDILKTASFVEDLMKRNLKVCFELQAQYPQTKSANCYAGVMNEAGRESGVGYMEMMGLLADKEQMKQANLDSEEMRKQLESHLKSITAGVGGKIRGSKKPQSAFDVSNALGGYSSLQTFKTLVQEARK